MLFVLSEVLKCEVEVFVLFGMPEKTLTGHLHRINIRRIAGSECNQLQ